MDKSKKQIFYIIAFFSILRFFVSPYFGIGTDEAHYILYAKHLSLSYFDHPPLVGWVHSIFYYTIGTNELIARMPAILIFGFTTYLIYLLFFKMFNSNKSALLCAIAINCSFMLNALSICFLPESLLFPLGLLIIFYVKKVVEKDLLKDWLSLGIFFGLAGISKYTAILFVPSVLIYFFLKKRIILLFSFKAFTMFFIAFIFISPVLFWNFANDMASFKYQMAHVSGGSSLSFKSFGISLLGQFVAYSPFFVIPAFYGVYKVFRLKNKNDYILLSFIFISVQFLFFTYSSFYNEALPHWTGFFYIVAIPFGVHFLYISKNKFSLKYLKFSIGISFFIIFLLYVEIIGKFISYPNFLSPFRDIYKVDKVMEKAVSIVKNDKATNKAIGIPKWTEGSRAIYYNKSDIDVFVLDTRFDQFDFWEKGKQKKGRDILLINSHFYNRRKLICSNGIEKVEKLDVMLNDSYVNSYEFIWCRDFQGIK